MHLELPHLALLRGHERLQAHLRAMELRRHHLLPG